MKILSQEDNQEDLCKEMDAIANNIKQCIISHEQYLLSVAKFTKTYRSLTKKSSNVYLMSALYKFGWGYGGTTSSQPIQAKSAGRQRKTASRGKAVVTSSRTPSSPQVKLSLKEKYFLPLRQKNN